MTYDKENRLVDWKQNKENAVYAYNWLGQKVNEFSSPAVGPNDQPILWDGDDYLGFVLLPVPDFSGPFRTVDGVMLGFGDEDYLVDFLGSITCKTRSVTGAILTTHRYKPYGARLSGPFFGSGFFWTGNTGSRSTGQQFAEQYNRARHDSTILSQWTTRDALWPMELPHTYVRKNSVTWINPTGQRVRRPTWDPTQPSTFSQPVEKDYWKLQFGNCMQKSKDCPRTSSLLKMAAA